MGRASSEHAQGGHPHLSAHLAGAVPCSEFAGDGRAATIGGNYRVLPAIYSNFVSFLGDDRIPIIFSA